MFAQEISYYKLIKKLGLLAAGKLEDQQARFRE